MPDHGDLHADVGSADPLLGDAGALMAEQDDRALPCRLQPR